MKELRSELLVSAHILIHYNLYPKFLQHVSSFVNITKVMNKRYINSITLYYQ